MKRGTKTINAKDKVLGRLAVEVALILRGKEKPDFAPNKDIGDIVVVENVDEMKLTGKKFKGKLYRSHTGWPGGFKEKTMQEIVEKKGFKEILRRAVYGMLPKNKLRQEQIKRLKFK